jgi:hypothetical protein
MNISNIDIDINTSNIFINTFNADLFSEGKRNYARNQRNQLLTKTDKYLIPDFPITSNQLIEVKDYRQILRDFFSRDDVINYHYNINKNEFPELPDVPSFIS